LASGFRDYAVSDVKEIPTFGKLLNSHLQEYLILEVLATPARLCIGGEVVIGGRKERQANQ
jgi:hypothetical protein